MFPAARASSHLRGEVAGETLAVRARRKASGSHVQLAGFQGQQLSKAQTGVDEEVSGLHLALAPALQSFRTAMLPPLVRRTTGLPPPLTGPFKRWRVGLPPVTTGNSQLTRPPDVDASRSNAAFSATCNGTPD